MESTELGTTSVRTHAHRHTNRIGGRTTPLLVGLGEMSNQRWLVQELGGLPVGRALDIGCGDGRASVWLARRGWRVTGIDVSEVALEAARRRVAELPPGTAPVQVKWVHADPRYCEVESGAYDVIIVSYVQLRQAERRRLIRSAVSGLASRGRLIVVGWDTTNVMEGVGGPQDPRVLFTSSDIADDVRDYLSTGALSLVRGGRVAREVQVGEQALVAWDSLTHLRRRDADAASLSLLPQS